jgi:myo-inositol 2-dehydrogenase/D-chiro-inositol 1-dehydrogenase
VSSRVGVAIVGCGEIAHSHAAALNAVDEAELVAAVDLDAGRAEAFAARFRVGTASTRFEEVLARDDVDAVVVSAPNSSHAALTVQALRAGKHVLVQKPMALTLDEADEMLAAAAESGSRLMVSFFQLFHPAVLRAKEIIRSGAIGDVFLVKAIMAWYIPTLENWRFDRDVAGGGILMDSHSHNIGVFNWLLDVPEVESVYAELGTLACDADVEDTGIVLIRTPSAIGEISGSCRLLEPNSQIGGHFKDRVELFGTNGTIHITPTERPALRVFVEDGGLPPELGGGWIAPGLDAVPVPERGYSAHFNGDEDPWVGEHRHFVRCLLDGEPFVSDGHFGRRVQETLAAAYASADAKRAFPLTAVPAR